MDNNNNKKWFLVTFKETSPKNENVVTIYSPSCRSKPVYVSFLCWKLKKIFWRTKLSLIPIDIHSMGTINCLINIRKKLKQGLEQHKVSKWQHLNFWVSYPFKSV